MLLTRDTLPETIPDIAALDELLCRPSQALIDDLNKVEGDIMVLGVAGKMGPTLAGLAKAAVPKRRVIGVARFSEPDVKDWLQGRGVEIAGSKVQRAIQRGVSVYQGDIDEGLADYPDQAFDYVILSQTLQETLYPRHVLQDMLRVGRHGIVAFPNFGHSSVRFSMLKSGRAPRTKLFPYEWFESPNIHFLTVDDFEELVALDNFVVERRYFLSGSRKVTLFPNLRAEVAVYLVKK